MTVALDHKFWDKVDIGKKNDCWNWLGAVNDYGYGKVRRGAWRSWLRTHRYAWEEVNGPVPYGLSVLHRCDNPRCCNPLHLFVGTQQDNVNDMVSKGRAKGGGLSGEHNPNAKLSLESARLIRNQRHKASARQLAKQYHVHANLIYMIWSNLIWVE